MSDTYKGLNLISSNNRFNIKTDISTISKVSVSPFIFQSPISEVKGDAAPANVSFYGIRGVRHRTADVLLSRTDEQGEALSNSGIFIADRDLATLQSILKRVDSRSTHADLQILTSIDSHTSSPEIHANFYPSPSVSSGVVGIVMVAVFGSLLIIGAIGQRMLINPVIAGIIIIFGVSFIAMHFSSQNHAKP